MRDRSVSPPGGLFLKTSKSSKWTKCHKPKVSATVCVVSFPLRRFFKIKLMPLNVLLNRSSTLLYFSLDYRQKIAKWACIYFKHFKMHCRLFKAVFPVRPPAFLAVKRNRKTQHTYYYFYYEGVPEVTSSQGPPTCCHSSPVSQSGKPRSFAGEFRRHVANRASWLEDGCAVETPNYSGWVFWSYNQQHFFLLNNHYYSVIVKTVIFNEKKRTFTS